MLSSQVLFNEGHSPRFVKRVVHNTYSYFFKQTFTDYLKDGHVQWLVELCSNEVYHFLMQKSPNLVCALMTPVGYRGYVTLLIFLANLMIWIVRYKEPISMCRWCYNAHNLQKHLKRKYGCGRRKLMKKTSAAFGLWSSGDGSEPNDVNEIKTVITYRLIELADTSMQYFLELQ